MTGKENYEIISYYIGVRCQHKNVFFLKCSYFYRV